MMKKTLPLLACLVLLLCALSGCSGPAKPADAPSPTTPPAPTMVGVADNEILTYDRLDPAKTTLVVSRTGNVYITRLAAAFEERNPDVQVVCLDITGGNDACHPVIDWVVNGVAPDIMFCGANMFPDQVTAEYFEDLSTDPLVERYETASLDRVDVDGRLYWLPGPSDLYCMIYNQTLFERYGWEVPKTFDQFVAVCRQIREDTNGAVEPWNPNAKYDNDFRTVTEAFVYPEVFGGVENRTWLHAFSRGEATFAGHMEPYYNVLQTLIDNDLLHEEHFSYSATARGKEFLAGEIAMINYYAQTYQSEGYRFAFMPIPSTQGELGYISSPFSCLIGVPKKARSETLESAIDRFLAFLSSPEGQEIFIGDSMKVSNLKGATLNEDGALAALKDVTTEGHLFESLTFKGADGQPANFTLRQDALSMTKGEKTAAECIAAVDAEPYAPVKQAEAGETVATAEADFTILETSQYIADMYRETADAQIGLIVNAQAYRGNLMRIFRGPLTAANVVTLLPRSLGNGSTLVKAAMTGRQLLDAMNHPVANDDSANCTYAFSGLKATVAPWKPLGEMYLSVTLADGTAIDPEATYTVAFWEGTIREEYITGDVERLEGSFGELLTAKLKKDSAIRPATDGRITLVWE